MYRSSRHVFNECVSGVCKLGDVDVLKSLRSVHGASTPCSRGSFQDLLSEVSKFGKSPRILVVAICYLVCQEFICAIPNSTEGLATYNFPANQFLLYWLAFRLSHFICHLVTGHLWLVTGDR